MNKFLIKKSIIALILLILSSLLIKPALADIVSPLDFIFPARPTYLVMQIDKTGKILSKKKIEETNQIFMLSA